MGQEEEKLRLGALEIYKTGKLNRNFFDFQYVIGKGGFGKVSLNYNQKNILIGVESMLQKNRKNICYKRNV